MSNTIRATFFGVAAMTSLLAVGPAKADHVSVGLGLSDGLGNFLSLGVNTGGRHGCGPAYVGGVCMAPRQVIVAPAPVVYAPAPVVYAQPAPVVYAPAPVVYAQPAPVVYAQPAPVVYAQAPVVMQNEGYWVESDNNVWVSGVWVDVTDSWGRRIRQQQPGHWEMRHSREWQSHGGGDRQGPRRDFGGGDRDGHGHR